MFCNLLFEISCMTRIVFLEKVIKSVSEATCPMNISWVSDFLPSGSEF